MEPGGQLVRSYLKKTTVVQKQSIDAWDQPLCVTTIVFVVGSKSQTKRYLFNMNAKQHS
jgi:hypothetical protein